MKITNFIDSARHQLLKEQLENRVVELDDWMKQCDSMWKEHNVLIPYPKYPSFPTDDEIYSRAKSIYESEQEKNKEKEINEKINIETMVEQPKEEVGIIKINSQSEIHSQSEENNTQNTEKISLEEKEKQHTHTSHTHFNYRKRK